MNPRERFISMLNIDRFQPIRVNSGNLEYLGSLLCQAWDDGYYQGYLARMDDQQEIDRWVDEGGQNG